MAGGGEPETWWRRLFGAKPPTIDGPQLEPSDKYGAALYADFTDCLDQHRFHVFFALAAITLPWSFLVKDSKPFALAMTVAYLPDLLYANWRCDTEYKAFKAHCQRVQQDLDEQRAAAAAARALPASHSARGRGHG